MMWRISFLVLIVCLATLTNGQQTPAPPIITNFLTRDLLAPEDVKFRTDNAMKLPCAASGSNLKWTWKHNDTEISAAQLQDGNQFKVGSDGTLTGSNLGTSESGNYQCFVRDTVTNVVTFSRKIKVAVTVVGTFINPTNTEEKVDLGEELSIDCPSHNPSFGVSYYWTGKIGDTDIQFKRNDRRAISQTGQLFIMYVTQEDFDEVAEFQNQGIKCSISAANSYQRSGLVKITKRTPGKIDPGTKRAPSWRKIPGVEETAVEGRNKTLYCLAVGRPVPTITWKKLEGGTWKNLVHGQGGHEIDSAFQGRLLNIFSVQRDLHQTRYRCEALNSESNGIPLVHETNLVVEVAPKWSQAPPSELSIDIKTNESITCDVSGDPVPSFTWYKNGQKLVTSTNNVRLDNNRLNFNLVRYPDEAGVYQCVAENNHGMIVSSTWVKVLAIAPSFKENGFGPFFLIKGTEGRLKCNPKSAPHPNVFRWYKEGQELKTTPYSVEADGTLVIKTVTRERDQGEYECYAENVLGSASAKGNATVLGVPFPPSNLSIINCFNRITTLFWISGATNNAPITHFLIEQESTYEPNVFRVIANVTSPNATSIFLDLTGWATLRFRVRAANRFGPSRASLATTQKCITKVGVPDKYPDNLRVVPRQAGDLDITWTAMQKIDWNAPGLYYILKYRSLPNGTIVTKKINDSSVSVFRVPNPGYYKQWEFQIQAGNDQGVGPMSSSVTLYTVPDPPSERPEDFQVGAVGARTVELLWRPVHLIRGRVDGYRIYYWSESRLKSNNVTSTDVPGGNTKKHTVTQLTPNTNYTMVIKAFNSNGEGPASIEVLAFTEEAAPGPPSDVQVYAFAKYILLTWKAPLEPNGVITKYRLGSKQFSGSQPADDLVVNLEEIGANQNRKLLGKQTPEKNYVVEIQAKTGKGWGNKTRKILRTVKYAAPAKPRRPTVEGTASNKVRVTYNFGLGGGYTHEFLVMYRRKDKGEAYKNTSWVNHFEAQSTEIDNLSPELYEFKTVGRNDYPHDPNESPASDVTEERPLQGVVNAAKPSTTPSRIHLWMLSLWVSFFCTYSSFALTPRR